MNLLPTLITCRIIAAKETGTVGLATCSFKLNPTEHVWSALNYSVYESDIWPRNVCAFSDAPTKQYDVF